MCKKNLNGAKGSPHRLLGKGYAIQRGSWPCTLPFLEAVYVKF